VARGGYSSYQNRGGGNQTSQSTQSVATPRRWCHNGSRGSTSRQTGKWCATVESQLTTKPSVWSLKKKYVNPVEKEQQQHEQQQEADQDFDDAVHSFFIKKLKHDSSKKE
jgi:hypothetical protein